MRDIELSVTQVEERLSIACTRINNKLA